jgi:hypothetical protein
MSGMLSAMGEESHVMLPPGVTGPFEVYVNGVRQAEGVDFTRVGGELVFRRALRKEGRLGPWRWLSIFLGVAGTYRQNDSVDVVYEVGGRRVVASGLAIAPDQPAE